MSDQGERMNVEGERMNVEGGEDLGRQERVEESWFRVVSNSALKCCQGLWCLGNPEPQVGSNLGAGVNVNGAPAAIIVDQLLMSEVVVEPRSAALEFGPPPEKATDDEVVVTTPEERGQGDMVIQPETEDLVSSDDSSDGALPLGAIAGGYATDGGAIRGNKGIRDMGKGYYTSME